jgi:hypothetical protein
MGVVSDFSEAELRRMRAAAIDSACGLVLASPRKKTGKASDAGEVYLGEHETEWGTFHLYRRPPDPSMFRELLHQNLGRPGSRSPEKVDPIIVVKHCIPAIQELLPKDPEFGVAADLLGEPGEGDLSALPPIAVLKGNNRA